MAWCQTGRVPRRIYAALGRYELINNILRAFYTTNHKLVNYASEWQFITNVFSVNYSFPNIPITLSVPYIQKITFAMSYKMA